MQLRAPSPSPLHSKSKASPASPPATPHPAAASPAAVPKRGGYPAPLSKSKASPASPPATPHPAAASPAAVAQQFKLLVKATTTPPGQPLHHVVFSPGYKDRIKFSKSKSRGHPAKYWYQLVTKEALIFHNHYLSTSTAEVTKDVRGIARLLQKDANYGESLMTAPTRQPDLLQLYSRTVGIAWQA